MDYDTERAKEKAEELVNIVEEAIDKYWRMEGYNAAPKEMLNTAKQIVDNFVQITPPEKATIHFEFVEISSGGRGGGRSIKPGNIFLNFRKLITFLAESALTVIGAITVP